MKLVFALVAMVLAVDRDLYHKKHKGKHLAHHGKKGHRHHEVDRVVKDNAVPTEEPEDPTEEILDHMDPFEDEDGKIHHKKHVPDVLDKDYDWDHDPDVMAIRNDPKIHDGTDPVQRKRDMAMMDDAFEPMDALQKKLKKAADEDVEMERKFVAKTNALEAKENREETDTLTDDEKVEKFMDEFSEKVKQEKAERMKKGKSHPKSGKDFGSLRIDDSGADPGEVDDVIGTNAEAEAEEDAKESGGTTDLSTSSAAADAELGAESASEGDDTTENSLDTDSD